MTGSFDQTERIGRVRLGGRTNALIVVQAGADVITDRLYIDVRLAYDNGGDLAFTKKGVRFGHDVAEAVIALIGQAHSWTLDRSIEQLQEAKNGSGNDPFVIRR